MSQILNHLIYCICKPSLHSKDYVDGVISGLRMARTIPFCWRWSRLTQINRIIELIKTTRKQLEEKYGKYQGENITRIVK